MNNSINNIFYLFIIICAIALPFAILQFVFREKYVIWRGYPKRYTETFQQHPEQKEKILSSMKKLVSIYRFNLYLFPIYLFFFPWAMYKYADFNGLVVFISMALYFTIVVFTFLYVKWFYRYLVKLDLP